MSIRDAIILLMESNYNPAVCCPFVFAQRKVVPTCYYEDLNAVAG